MKKKSLILVMSALTLLLSLQIPITSYAENEIQVYVNQNKLSFQVAPYIKYGRTLAPFRSFLEEFGAKITWDGETKTVVAIKYQVEITLTIGDSIAIVNGHNVVLDVPPEITRGRTFVPLRFISETFNAKVAWFQEEQKITVDFHEQTYSVGDIKIVNNFTLDELSRFNGRYGMPGYMSINGIVYDVSSWRYGEYLGLTAGNDLTNEFYNYFSNTTQDALISYPIVGNLITK